ncbi:MAG: type I pullulanase [Muribaculaceae bacterium]|nr:type I pullulanase [Muribaculaceae bacterium]
MDVYFVAALLSYFSEERIMGQGGKGGLKNRRFDKEFDRQFCYDGKDLGAVCTRERTVFKVWSPLAEKIELFLYRTGNSDAYMRKEMKLEEKGVWKQEFLESLHGMYYDYLVWINGKSTRTADPYATGCCCNGARSMVVDLELTNPQDFALDKAPAPGEECIVYELHIKDFSYDADSRIPEQYRGKYKAFTVPAAEGEYPVCMEYLKKLGITHVQLMPFFDFGSVDEAGDETQFNWGYDPINYNVPEGSYATDTADGTVRIRECKEMIQALHENGFRVIMDVVYNHTFYADSWLQRMAPGYYYRTWEDGRLSDGSACGNDIAAGRVMVDNYIADSVMYWAKEYHVDGFRFDLMGLLTADLMNRIRREMDEAFGPGEKMLYGEPWRADISAMEEGTKGALKDNIRYLDEGIGIFCDDTRDVIKGSVFEAGKPGFVNGEKNLESLVLHAVTGWMDGGASYAPRCCAQIMNYVSVHDNLTLWDKLLLSMHQEETEHDFTACYPDVLAANKLAAFIYFTCQGNLLFHAGEEFGRTKYGESNSYHSSPELNMLRWRQTVEFEELVHYYTGLIRLRKKLPGLCDKTPSAADRITQKEIHGDRVVSFRVDNRERDGKSSENGGWEELWIIYNAASEEYEMKMPEGTWEILADGKMTDGSREAGGVENKIRVEALSGMLLGRKAG